MVQSHCHATLQEMGGGFATANPYRQVFGLRFPIPSANCQRPDTGSPPPYDDARLLGGDLVAADVAALEAVGDADDLGFGEERLEEVELGATSVLVTLGNGEDSAVVLGQTEGAVGQLGEVGQVSVLVEDLGDHRDLAREGQAVSAGTGALQAGPTPLRGCATQILTTH